MKWPWQIDGLSRNDRAQAWEMVKSLGLPADPAAVVPLEFEQMRPLDSVLDRIFVLHAVSAVAHGFSAQRSEAWIQQERLGGHLTPDEASVLEGANTDFEPYREQVEALWALFWLAGLTPKLDPVEGCPDTFVQLLPDIRLEPMPTTFSWRSRARPRTRAEAQRAGYEAACLVWAFDQAKASGRPTPQLQSGLWVRHRFNALAWASGSQDWAQPVAGHQKWWK